MNIKQALIILTICIFTSSLTYNSFKNEKFEVDKEQILEEIKEIKEDKIEEVISETEITDDKKEPIIKETFEVIKPETKNAITDNIIPKEEHKESNSNTEIKEETITKPIINNASNEVDTNNFMYVIHKGIIDFNSSDVCASHGKEIAMNNIIDVLYFNCIEVNSKGNTVLGYYLDIVCESGNCNKYK